jgi:hypothetical protein
LEIKLCFFFLYLAELYTKVGYGDQSWRTHMLRCGGKYAETNAPNCLLGGKSLNHKKGISLLLPLASIPSPSHGNTPYLVLAIAIWVPCITHIS